MEISLAPQFRRQFKKLPPALRYESLEKIELFRNPTNHKQLRVHKLHGRFSTYYSFSVNYKYRIVFMWEVPETSAILLAIGDHRIYE